MPDTLTFYYVLPSADSTSVWGAQAVDAGQIYGPISAFSGRVAEQAPAWSEMFGVSISWQSGVMLLVLLLMFCYAVYRFTGLARVSFKSVFSSSETITLFENSTLEFSYFIHYGRWMFLLSTAIAADGIFLRGAGMNFINVAVIIGVVFVASTIGSWLIGILSFFDYDAARWKDLRSIRKIDRTISAYILALPVIAFSYSSSMHIALAVIVGAVLVAHFIRILIFFHWRGFSFLQSFLYLCAVEIAPFALLWGVAARLNGIHF